MVILGLGGTRGIPEAHLNLLECATVWVLMVIREEFSDAKPDAGYSAAMDFRLPAKPAGHFIPFLKPVEMTYALTLLPIS